MLAGPVGRGAPCRASVGSLLPLLASTAHFPERRYNMCVHGAALRLQAGTAYIDLFIVQNCPTRDATVMSSSPSGPTERPNLI